MPCFDCKQLSELSSSPFFSSAEHLSGFQRSELHQGIVFEKESHFVSRGTLRYRSVSSFAETVAMLLSEFIWNRQVVNGTKSCSSNVIVLPWIDLYLMIGVSEAEKENKSLNSASYAYFNIPISQIIYFHHQCTGWFSHPFPMFQSGKHCNFDFLCKIFENIHPLFILKWHYST